MKKIYTLISACALVTTLNSQNFSWAKREGLWAYDYGYGIVNDNAGNVYVAGKYEENANFSSTILPNQGNGNHDIFLAKYDAAGNLAWVQTGGGGLGDYAHAVACDGSNNVYVAGEIEYYSTNNVIVFPGSTLTLSPVGSNDAVLLKYDLSGNLLWGVSGGGSQDDKGTGVAFDNSGNVYICGYFTGTATFGGTTINGAGVQDIFVAKYDANGVFQWIQHGGSSGRDEPKSIKCDAAGNVYVCGFHSNGATFGSTTLNTSGGSYYDAFLAKYSSNGTLQWVKNDGGNYDDVAWSMTMDNSGLIYISGEFNASAFFGSTQLITSGNADVYVACYDANGTVQWAKSAGGPLIDRARGIGCDGTTIYLTGQFGSTANFGSHSLVAADSSDIFIASISNSGNFGNALSVGGAPDSLETLGYESGIAVCAEPTGEVYATGALLDGGIFGTTSLSKYGRTDVFITKITQLNNVATYTESNGTFLVYPNPSNGNIKVSFNKQPLPETVVNVFNCYGQMVASKNEVVSPDINLDLSEQQSGVYFIELKQNNESVLRRRVVLQK
ncbi:MAG: T9SS type A sorting domain-containing protein [Bacteroidia bacterium]